MRSAAATGAIEIDLRGFADGEVEQPAGAVRIEPEGGVVRRVVALPDGRDRAEAWLEPEPLGRYGEPEEFG